MLEVLFWLLVVVSILVFALVGFVQSLIWAFGSKEESPSPPSASPTQPTISGDVQASRRLIDYLHSEQKINAKAYGQLKNYLERNFPESPESLSGPAIDRKPRRETKLANANSGESKIPPRAVPTPVGELPPVQIPVPDPQNTDENLPVVVAQLVQSSGPSITSASVSQPVEPVPVARRPAEPMARPAPWELPDPPERKPHRSFGELMSGFMQEKNMRWGELTSGILIVLSAVGLVVSLREELRNTIPYFSALIFMMITAAIHGAGIYTLKKWKLRNTSRGTLIIGLLLVPLNFVAACVLSDRRSWNDPWLWAAMVIGISTFTLMTWWSSKYLLRRGNLPMTVAIIGSGIGTLLINRAVESVNSSFLILLLALPVAVSFLIGTCTFDTRQWARQSWSERSLSRMFLFLGVSVFAAMAAVSLIPVRSERKLFCLVAILPIASVICIVTGWIGSIAYRGSLSSLQDRFEGSADRSADAPSGLQMGGLVLKILGLLLLAFSLLVSVNNPIVFVVNCLVATFGLIPMLIHQNGERLIPIAWGVFAAGALMGLNVATGTLGFDEWTSIQDLQAALINGKSALCLLLVGVVVGAANGGLKRWFPSLDTPGRFVRQGWVTGGSISFVGCLMALIASLIHRDNVFDSMVASGLLTTAAVGLIVVCVFALGSSNQWIKGLPHYGAGMLLVALAHAMIWNPTISNWLDSLDPRIHGTWIAMFAMHGTILVVLGWWLNRPGLAKGNAFSQQFVAWGSVSNLIVTYGALTLVSSQTGWATGFELVACVVWFLAGVVWNREGNDFKEFAPTPFVLATGVLACVVVAELVSRWDGIPAVNSPQHWLVQMVVISGWSMLWTGLTRVFESTQNLRWLSSRTASIDQVVLYCLTIAITVLVSDVLAVGVVGELSRASNIDHLFRMGDGSGWMIAALAAIGMATLISLIATPLPWKAVAAIGIWFLAWSYGAAAFSNSKSVASALRWLVPLAGLVAGGLIACRRPGLPAWAGLRTALGFTGRSFWSQSWTQQLINIALFIATAVVLLISTVTVSQVLLNGAGALGGPNSESWFRLISPEIAFGLPVALIVATFLLYAISERRTWLATIGSAVFQYVVLLAVVLLFLSPHPKLASSWFVNILKAVSLGMTGYGCVWFWLYDRIEGGTTAQLESPTENRYRFVSGWISQLELHTLLNGLLISSLAVLAMGRYFLIPDQPGAWISSVGSPLGVAAWAAFGVLATCVWRRNASNRYSIATWVWLLGWMGMILVGLGSAVMDRMFAEEFIAWLPFRSVMIGALLVSLVQFGLIVFLDPVYEIGPSSPESRDLGSVDEAKLKRRRRLALPVLSTGAVALVFAVRGSLLHPAEFWLYILVIVALTVLPTMLGWLLRDGRLSLVSASVAVLGVSLVVREDPQGWFSDNRPDWFNLIAIVLSLLALSWLAFAQFRSVDRRPLPVSFLWLPNVVLWAGTLWIVLAALLEFAIGSGRGNSGSSLSNPLGVIAFVTVAGLAFSTLWAARIGMRVVSWCLLSVALAITLASVVGNTNQWRVVGATEGVAWMVAVWGIGWLNREKLFAVAERVGSLNRGLLGNSLRRQLPICSWIFGGLVMLIAWGVIFRFEIRAHRYLAAAVPFTLAIGFGAQSNPSSRRWFQHATLLLATTGVLFLAWADLSKAQMNTYPMIRVLVRGLIVLAATMFVYGGLVTRWVRSGDTWLKSLREMAVVTCAMAIVCLVLVVASESSTFVENEGCGLMVGESLVVAILVAGMIAGLVMIAIRPKNDPFALSMNGRMGYVYAAEFVGLSLIAHLYFSMPWLFQLGIKDYWPYLMMACCFGGIGIAHVLEKRKLTVLGKPLFNTAAIMPLAVAIAIFGIDSLANRELVMLTIGMAYLMISVTRRSVFSGAASIVFGTLAMWMYFQSNQFSFFQHPQLWLIPPAVSTLIAGQICIKTLSSKQLSALRYICITVIYVSSTMEVFISGVGEQLWPPVILAILAVVGIMAGIMFRVKSFLYFGSLFLLMAMITMVSHAHQRLNHVWPWWAFGIGLGIAILVMFGLFEKRKNELKAIAAQFKDWEA